MSYSPEGPTVDLRCGGYIMGDEVEVPASEDLKISVGRHTAGDIIRIITERGIEQEVQVSAADTCETLALTLPVESRRFYRVEIWRHFADSGRPLMAAMTNPIYFRS
jgi:hypothetical protein